MVDKNKRKGWEVAQWGNCLVNKPGDLKSILSSHFKGRFGNLSL